MSNSPAETGVNLDYYRADHSQDLVLKLFNTYYRAHQHSGKLFDEAPGFFLAKPQALDNAVIATRASDKLILEDCIQRATTRGGYVGVFKHFNPKLQYYWLELVVMPFELGDPITEHTKMCFFFLLSHFVEFSKQNTKIYGDITAECASDKDLALMLKEIIKLGNKLQSLLEIYSEEQLVSFNRNWPPAEVKKLLAALKENDLEWCELFFECMIYVMGRKPKG